MQSKENFLILLLQLIPFVVLILVRIHPYSVIPIFIGLAVVFAIVFVKIVHESIAEADRDDYYTRGFEYREDAVSFFMDNDFGQGVPGYLIPHLQALGVSWPYTMEELNRAFRRVARRTHPDMPGGNQRAFVRARQSYEELKEYLEEESKYLS